MLCEKCQAKQATVHMVKIVNGEKTEQHLCEDCAAKSGDFLNSPEINLQKLFPYFAWHPSSPPSKVNNCPVCGWSLAELESTGKLGCSNCYEHFRQYVNPILQRIHTSNVHNGKKPLTAAAAKNNGTPVPRGLTVAQLKAKELAELKANLTRCVMEEKFEAAAALRDRIKLLEEQKDPQEKSPKKQREKPPTKEGEQND